MKTNKNKYFYLIILTLLSLFVYFSNSYYKKSEKEKIEYKQTIKSLSVENTKLNKLNIELSLKVKEYQNKDIEIIEEKNKDGSSKKITRIKENKGKDLNSNVNVKKEDLNLSKKEEVLIKEDYKKDKEKIEEKKTNYIIPLMIVGGLVLCFSTGVCIF
jgi:hypothetical protein